MHTRLFGRLRSSEVAFTVVVIAAYAVLFTTYDFKIYDPQSLVWIVLGAIYLGIGLYGSRLLNDREHRAPWLLPLIGTAVENLSRVWVVIICIVIWLGDGLSIGGHIRRGIFPGGAALMEGPYAHMADPSRGGLPGGLRRGLGADQPALTLHRGYPQMVVVSAVSGWRDRFDRSVLKKRLDFFAPSSRLGRSNCSILEITIPGGKHDRQT